MSGNRFRLETLLKVRQQQRDVRREALAKAFRAEEIIAERIQETQQDLDALRNLQRRSMAAGARLDVDRLLNQGRQEQSLKAELVNLSRQQQQIAAEREQRRAALVEADRAVQVLEKLKEKLAARRQDQLDRAERIELDEIAEQLFQARKRLAL